MIISEASELGYAFTHDFCEAISAYTQGEVDRDKAVFGYRGANLRFAVERSLYFTCVNSEALFHLYRSAKDGKLPYTVSLPIEEVIVARLLLPKEYAEKVRTQFNWRYTARRMGLRFVRDKLREWQHGLRRDRHSQQALHTKYPDILFHINHEKFARYLQPITEALTTKTYAYLLVSRGTEDLKAALIRQKQPILNLSSNSRQQNRTNRESAKGNSLNRFPFLVEIFDRIYTALELAKPRCVVVVEGNAPVDVITREVCSLLLIPIICIQQGWCPYIHNGFRNMAFTKMLVWGSGFENLLKPFNPYQEFVAVGNHVLQQLSKKGSNQSNEEILGIGFFLQAPDALLSEAGHLEFLSLIPWAAETFPDIPIIVRSHPNYPLSYELEREFSQFPNFRLMSPATHCLEEVFAASKIAMSVYSSTILESIAVGVLPVVCNTSSLPRYYPDIAKEGAGIETNSANGAKSAIRRLIHEPAYFNQFQQGMDRFRKQYFEQGDAITRIIAEITDINGK